MKKQNKKIKPSKQMKKEESKALKDGNKKGVESLQVMKSGLQSKIIGQKRYTDTETGEVVIADIVHKEAFGDTNFFKIWIADLIGLIDTMAKGKMKIFFYLIDCMRKDNLILAGTTRQIAAATKSSLATVYETLDYLHERDIIRTIQKGVYQLNPDLIFRGGSNHRRAILVQYKKIDTIELTKDKQLNIEENGKEN